MCRQIFGKGGETVWMQPPFYCDYGSNIELGERVLSTRPCAGSRNMGSRSILDRTCGSALGH